jgi:hypothetical protein
MTKKQYLKLLKRVDDLESRYYALKSQSEIPYGEYDPHVPTFGRRRPTLSIRKVVQMILTEFGMRITRDAGTPPSYDLESKEYEDAQ